MSFVHRQFEYIGWKVTIMGLLIFVKNIISYHPPAIFLKQLSVSQRKFRMASSTGTGGNGI